MNTLFPILMSQSLKKRRTLTLGSFPQHYTTKFVPKTIVKISTSTVRLSDEQSSVSNKVLPKINRDRKSKYPIGWNFALHRIILERDENACRICACLGEKLRVHH